MTYLISCKFSKSLLINDIMIMSNFLASILNEYICNFNFYKPYNNRRILK